MAAAATKIKAGREEAVTTVLVLIAGTMTEVVVVVVVATAVVEEAVALAVDEEQAHSTTHLAVDMIQVAIMTPTPLHLWVGTASMTVVYKGRARKIHTITRDHHRQLTTLDSSGMRRRRRLMLMTRTGSRRMAVDIKAQAPITTPTTAPAADDQAALQVPNDHGEATTSKRIRTSTRATVITAVEERRRAMR